MVKKLKTNETGRSMVEMLGVLAVVGVLSVAGIAGYTSAMRSYRTNEIVNAVSAVYVMGLAQKQGSGDQELTYAGNLATNNPSGVTDLKYNPNKTVTMSISDEKDCAMVKNKLGDKISGECNALTVNFGEATTTETPQQDPCGQCTIDPTTSTCSGVGDCSGCIRVRDENKCVSESTCNKICAGQCADNDTSGFFEYCCERSDEFKKGCPESL